jgi:hypothetical protein
MNLRHIVILLIIILFLFTYLTDMYKKMEINKFTNEFISIKEDDNDLYINPYLTQNEVIPNVIKKYNDNKINVINVNGSQTKNIYDTVVTSSLNNNMNRNNLIHFINFLI